MLTVYAASGAPVTNLMLQGSSKAIFAAAKCTELLLQGSPFGAPVR